MPSAIAAKARAEAEKAEAEEHEHEQPAEPAEPSEEPAEQPAEEPTQPGEPHPGEGLEEPSDAMIAELRAACDEHADHVRAIMGPFVEGFVTCESCNGIGIAYPAPATPKLEHAPGTTECTVCKGHGELETGSRRQGYTVIGCTNCNGHGYVGAGNLPPADAARAAAEASIQPAELPAEQPVQAVDGITDPRALELIGEGYLVMKRPGT